MPGKFRAPKWALYPARRHINNFSEVDGRFKLVDGTQRGCSLYLTATQASDIPALRRLVQEVGNARLDGRAVAECEERRGSLLDARDEAEGTNGDWKCGNLNITLGS